MTRSRLAWVMVGVAALFFVGCKQLEEELGETPTEPEPVATVSPISIPVVVPESNPTPEPTSTPVPGTPEPTPTPEPNPPSGGNGCGAPPNEPPHPVCGLNPPLFLDEVQTAITRTEDKHPDLFDFSSLKCPDCPFVKNIDRYIDYVLAELAAQGLCTYWDGDEIAVKQNNNRSEQYDPILSSGHVRWGDGSYRGDCQPSWF
jgi:hypothetical protein